MISPSKNRGRRRQRSLELSFTGSPLICLRIYHFAIAGSANHHPAQGDQEESQQQPAGDPLQDDIIPVPAQGQKVDGPLGEKDHGAEEEGVSQSGPLRQAILLRRTAQGPGGAADAVTLPEDQAEAENGEKEPGYSISRANPVAAGEPCQNINDLGPAPDFGILKQTLLKSAWPENADWLKLALPKDVPRRRRPGRS
jgi:hypothetical protein